MVGEEEAGLFDFDAKQSKKVALIVIPRHSSRGQFHQNFKNSFYTSRFTLILLVKDMKY